MSETLFSTIGLGGDPRAGYRLQHAEVYNWGTFDNHTWRFSPGTDTALLTGDIGSGKSTLVDALTTLLVPSHKAAYNKAAGADAKERTLRSYVEGHYKSERNESTGKSRSKGLRENKHSYSVILGVFRNHGYDETVTLAQVFQQRDKTGQPYRFFVTATTELAITTDFGDFGTELRDLRKKLRDSGAEIFDEFPKYATSLRRLLGIRSEQALELFHQTVSMKSVGNLNDFVRDHMLEPSDSTDRVREIIGHFDDLTKAHDAVKRAREQLDALQPIADTAAKYDAALTERGSLELERSAVRLFIAELRSGLLTDEITRLEAEGAALWQQQDTAEAEHQRLGRERDALIEERAQAGGDRIGELERLAAEALAQAETRRDSRILFDVAVADAGLEPVADGAAFVALSTRVAAERPRLAEEKRDIDGATVDAIGREREYQRKCEVLTEEIASLEQRTTTCRASRWWCARSCVTRWGSPPRICPMPVNCSTFMRNTPSGAGRPNACCVVSRCRCWCRNSITTPSRHGSTDGGSPSPAAAPNWSTSGCPRTGFGCSRWPPTGCCWPTASTSGRGRSRSTCAMS